MNIKNGFTLLEILVSIAIITLLTAIGWNTLSRFRQTVDLNRSAEAGISSLNDARSRTLSSVDSSQYGVHFQTDSVVLFKGTSYATSNPDNVEFLVPGTVQISSISLTGGGSDVLFARLTGATNQSGTITFRLSANTAETRMITILSSGVISQGPPMTVSSTGLAGYWKFDEGSAANAADSSGNANNGVLTNMNSSADWVAGKLGSALNFDGEDDYISISGSPSLNITNAITVAMWIKPAVSSLNFHSGWNFFIYHRNPLKYEIGYSDVDGPHFKPYNDAGIGFDFSAVVPLSAGIWYHVAMVRTNTILSIYINGMLSASRNDFTGNLRSTSDELRIGGDGGSGGFQGVIDDVRIYSRALTPQEIGLLSGM